jgi:peptidyl-prolyl cis-trans isomerase C
MRTVTLRSSAPSTVSVNDAVIAHADIAREVQNHPAPSPKQAWGAATHALVVRELLLQRARSMHFVVKPHSENSARETDEDALIRTLIETEITTPNADEAACRHYYQANPSRFRTPVQGELLPFDKVHARITAYIEETAWRRAVAQYIALLVDQARITGCAIHGTASPLVQ